MKQNYGCIAIAWVVWFIAAFLYNIDPDYEYGWAWAMFWHGPLTIPNWIISLFNSDKYYLAPLHTTGYTFWWWILLIINAYSFLGTIFYGIKQLLHRK